METSLCRNLRLSIDLVEQEAEQLIKFRLEDPVQMEQIEVCQTIGANTANRSYHQREAMVIGMRRLVSAAIDKNLIKTAVSSFHGISLSQLFMKGSNTGGQDLATLFATGEE